MDLNNLPENVMTLVKQHGWDLSKIPEAIAKAQAIVTSNTYDFKLAFQEFRVKERDGVTFLMLIISVNFDEKVISGVPEGWVDLADTIVYQTFNKIGMSPAVGEVPRRLRRYVESKINRDPDEDEDE